MKRIIAGGTGLIGQYLVRKWLLQGHEIVVMGRYEWKIKQLFGDKVIPLSWDKVTELELAQAELAVNLAGANIGERFWTPLYKKTILNSRIKTTKTIAELCAKLGSSSPTLLNASAIGVYGLQNNTTYGLPPELDENTPIDFNSAPDFLSEVGRAWEKATFIARDASVRVVNMRFGVVLAKEGGVLPKLALQYFLYLGGKIGSGQQPFSWISLVDLGRAIDFIIEDKKIIGPINLVAPECVTQKDFSKTLAAVLKRPAKVNFPAWFLKFAGGQMVEELMLKGQHVVPKRLQQEGFHFQYPDLASALKQIYNS